MRRKRPAGTASTSPPEGDAEGREPTVPGGEGVPPGAEGFRAGFVALVGQPNVGKSTLLNQLVGAHLSIVTPKVQTTRQRVAGIYTDEAHQAVFLDTPGLLEPRYLLQEAMREEAEAAAREADLLVYVADAGYPPSLEAAGRYLRAETGRSLLCLNKVDRVPAEQVGAAAARLEASGWEAVVPTVGTRGVGIPELRKAILSRLPPSPPLYPPDELATAPLRFFAAELVREACFEKLEEEVPYSVAVRIDEFRERRAERPLYIAATLFVERGSQRGIVIGAEGRKIREIGTAARRKIEAFLERRVYLELRVKVLPNWRRRRNHLKLLGFRALPKEP